MPKEEIDAFKFQCSVCCKYFNFPQKTWLDGGIVTCPYCGTRRRYTAHSKRVKLPPISESEKKGK